MTSGYSERPLAAKLGIGAGAIVAVAGDPGHFMGLLEPVPPDVSVRRSLRGKPDIAVLFVERAAHLRAKVGVLGRAIYPEGAAWIAWPKRSSGVPTDVTEDVVREIVLPLGMVDVKVAAIDGVWSGLKVVWRKALR